MDIDSKYCMLFLEEHNLSKLSPGKIDFILDLATYVKISPEYKLPFRKGISNPLAILDCNGKEVHKYTEKNNGRSKSELLLHLLNFNL